FSVKARDMDFNYSEPAKAQITVQPPPLIEISKTTITLPWFGTIPLVDFYRGLVGLSIAPLLALLILSLSRWRAYSRARRAIARGYNPYIAGRPITGAEMFFGRKEALAAVINGLPNHFAIHGVRRIGKTSLLRQLEHQIEQLQDPGRFFIPVSLNLQRVPQERLFHSLASAIADRCQAYTSPLNLIYNQKGPKDYDDFDLEDDIKAILAALKEATGKKGQIVLLLDEGDRINEYERQTQHQLRSIFQGKVQEHLTLVWAGVSIASIKDDTSPWYNLFAREIRLAPFTEEDALALIQEPVKGIYEYDTEAVRRILHYSQRQPYRIQQICHAVINLMLSERRRPHLFRSVRIRADDVEKAYVGLIAEEAERAKRPYEAEPLAEGVAEEGVTYQSGEEKGDAG
ncbi:MAG: AAA family ATPase, partial [Anaerolineae bacterium]